MNRRNYVKNNWHVIRLMYKRGAILEYLEMERWGWEGWTMNLMKEKDLRRD